MLKVFAEGRRNKVVENSFDDALCDAFGDQFVTNDLKGEINVEGYTICEGFFNINKKEYSIHTVDNRVFIRTKDQLSEDEISEDNDMAVTMVNAIKSAVML